MGDIIYAIIIIALCCAGFILVLAAIIWALHILKDVIYELFFEDYTNIRQ